MANCAILLVGDGGPVWGSCGPLLQRAGYVVLEAASADGALRLMKRVTPAGLLLRVDADAMALRLCRRIRSHAPFGSLPILGVIAGKPRLRLTGAGFSELLREPFAGEDLLRMVGRWLPVPGVGEGGRRASAAAVAPASEWRGLE